MLSHLELRSDAFPAYENESEAINPGRWGKRLAEFLSDGLRSRGEVVGDLIAEDWGWMVPIENQEFSLWLGVGNYEEYPDGFLCFIEPHTEYVRKLFKRVRVADRVSLLREKIDAVISSHSGISDAKWWSYDDFNTAKD